MQKETESTFDATCPADCIVGYSWAIFSIDLRRILNVLVSSAQSNGLYRQLTWDACIGHCYFHWVWDETNKSNSWIYWD